MRLQLVTQCNGTTFLLFLHHSRTQLFFSIRKYCITRRCWPTIIKQNSQLKASYLWIPSISASFVRISTDVYVCAVLLLWLLLLLLMASWGVSTVAVMVVMFLPSSSSLFATLPFRAGHLGHVGAVCVVVGAPPQVQRSNSSKITMPRRRQQFVIY